MASSCNSGGGSRRESYIRYANLNCHCHCLSEIKVSMSLQNPNRLFYVCKKNKCNWLGWCEPLPDEVDGKKRVETMDSYADAGLGNLEEEVDKLQKLVEGLTEAIQEEVATVKFEFDNGIADMKKDVAAMKKEFDDGLFDLAKDVAAVKKEFDDGISDVKNDFDKELLSLKKELKAIKQTNGNMKVAIFGLIIVLVLVVMNNHI